MCFVSFLHYTSSRFFQAIALFNANQDEEALLLVQELAARPNADPLACHVVEVSIMYLIKPGFVCSSHFLRFAHQACLRLQLGKIAMDGARHREAAVHFTAAVHASTSFAKLDIHSMYEDFVVVR
jgi:hypothetical protein